MSCGFVHIQSYSCSICVYTYTHKQNLGPLLSSALDSKVWRQDKKTLLRPHTCCNLQGNLQALSANRFAMDWGAIEASLSLHHRYHSDSQWKDVERQPKARAIHTRAEKMTLSPGDDDLPTKALEIACSDSAVRILLCSKICIFVLAYFSGVFPAKSATIRACAFAFCCSSEIPQQFISLNKSWHVLASSTR